MLSINIGISATTIGNKRESITLGPIFQKDNCEWSEICKSIKSLDKDVERISAILAFFDFSKPLCIPDRFNQQIKATPIVDTNTMEKVAR